MTEEFVTKAILKWLIDDKWKIICFDFPQSGTGRYLHPNVSSIHKNLGAINPDIVAVKNKVCVFFENKDRFYLPDFHKVNNLILNNEYTDDINKLLVGNDIDVFYYGIGLPCEKYNAKVKDVAHMVNFIVGVNENRIVEILHNSNDEIF